MSKRTYTDTKKQFYEAINKVRGCVIAISSDGSEESNDQK